MRAHTKQLFICLLVVLSSSTAAWAQQGGASSGKGNRGAAFMAAGNTDPDHQAPPNKSGEVVVTFDTMPTRMSFDLPGHIKMISENGIPYTNGATETYIPAEGHHEGASYESWNDHQNKYSRMWIESRNDARIVVRHRCALVKGDRICHQDKRKVAPYGPGNWTDEWYIIHPDGTYIRPVKIWNAVARRSGPHGAEFPYELEGMYLWWGQSPKGEMASDHLEDGAITLVRMDGSHETINLNPYPLKVGQYAKMRRVYGAFANANIHVINTKSEYRPWRVGRPSPRLSMSPYVPVHEQVQLVPCFPPATTRASGYSVAGLGQMVYPDFWKVTDDSMSEVWLNGWTNSREPADELAAIANSWWNAPKMALAGQNGTEVHGYDAGERAFLLTASASQGAFLNIAASAKSPVVNPMFLINKWGTDDPKLKIDGKEIKKSGDFRFGHYKTLELEGGRKWENVLAVWAKVRATDGMQVSISAEATVHPYRTWTSTQGTTIEARLVRFSGGQATLERRNGSILHVKPSQLSTDDRQYLTGK